MGASCIRIGIRVGAAAEEKARPACAEHQQSLLSSCGSCRTPLAADIGGLAVRGSHIVERLV